MELAPYINVREKSQGNSGALASIYFYVSKKYSDSDMLALSFTNIASAVSLKIFLVNHASTCRSHLLELSTHTKGSC